MVGIHTVTWCVEQSLVSVKNTASGARFSGLHDLGQAPYPLCDSTSSSVKWANSNSSSYRAAAVNTHRPPSECSVALDSRCCHHFTTNTWMWS